MKTASTATLVLILLVIQLAAFPAFSTAAAEMNSEDWLIRGIGSQGAAGYAYTSRKIFLTADAGATWAESSLELASTEAIAAVEGSHNELIALVTGPTGTIALAASNDGGSTWSRRRLAADADLLNDLSLDRAEIRLGAGGSIEIEFRIVTSSNFDGRAKFRVRDDGTLELISRKVELNTDAEPAALSAGEWTVVTEGRCAAAKQGCMQETRLVAKGRDITPPQIAAAAAAERSRLAAEAASSPMFALPPGGSTRISLNRGFDKCQAGTVAQMQAWWNNSPHYDTNIYMSGRNRACPTQPFTNNPTWINQVTAQGWGLIPTVVGYQSPCTSSTTTVKLSYDPVVAESQGRGEADIAVNDAISIGLTAGSILYYDMERYDPPSPDTLGCRAATVAFLKGWTDRIKELGYKSGTYGSPKNAQEDWVNLPPQSKMDAIWMARWDNVMSVWTYVSFPAFPTTEWANHQRIKQWQAPHNETWGGVTFNIDGNISDGPVAGAAILKNRNADFDGDGKTDHSVFRPADSTWYMLLSGNSNLVGAQFGSSATDLIVPGDYDGDGKTDMAVFRQTDGSWHWLNKAGIYATQSFGASGDIPVPADFNGDGKTDMAVFRPSSGVWYIANSDSRGTISTVPFGASGDKPLNADFDGDGREDIGIWRPNGASGYAEWWYMRSSDSQVRAFGFGSSSDQPVVGDHTGDGKDDIAFFQPSTGYWFVLRSEDVSYYAYPFGTSGDVAAPGDYDGDGKFDASVFRPSTGVWYVLRSTGGFSAIAFGQNGDRPIPAAY